MLKAVCLATALVIGGQAQAQNAASAAAPVSAAKKELVAKLLQLQAGGVEQLASSIAVAPAMQLQQQAALALQRVPAERREAVARDIEADLRKYAEEATPIVRERALKLAPSTLGPLLEERFTEDELRQVIAILESPVNRKFQSTFPEMQRAIGEKLVAETRAAIEPKVQAMQQSVSARLGLPAAASGGAAASAPKAAAPSKK